MNAGVAQSREGEWNREGKPWELHSDLAKLCLPAASRDANRKLAWINSICFVFLLVGFVGLKPPQVHIKELPQFVAIVPLEFTPAQEDPKVEPDVQPDESQPNPEPVVETPVVATVVASNPEAVNFPVPVEGPVVFAPAPLAAAPPPKPPARPPPRPPKVTPFNPGQGEGGSYPTPIYPRFARERGNEGTVTLMVIVEPSGIPSKVEVSDSSGYKVLDLHATEWVKNKWRWPSGEIRHYLVPIEFRISR